MRTKLEVRVHDLLPAGVPLGFVRARYRIARLFSEAPLLFLGVVIGVALVFRVGIGAIRTASADEAEPQATAREAPRVARPGASLSVKADDDPTIRAKKSPSTPPTTTALDMPADKLTPAASATVPHRAKARARRHP